MSFFKGSSIENASQKVLYNLFLSENSDSGQLLKSLLLSNVLLFLFLQFFSPLLCFLSKYLYSFPKVMLLLLNWKSLLSFLLQVILGLLRMAQWFESPIIPIFLYHTWESKESPSSFTCPQTRFSCFLI